jgi:L-histidine Nalpha-methyltransferase / hercynylcysteine S-oxide synthase
MLYHPQSFATFPHVARSGIDSSSLPRFILNGLDHANEILGENAFRVEDWKVIGEYIYDKDGGRHQAFYSPIRDTVVMGSLIRQHERIQVEQSLKFSRAETDRLWNLAALKEVGHWSRGADYGM